MEEIRKEFDIFLNELVKSYSTPTTTILDNPSSLAEVGSKSRDFNSKAKNKISELATKYQMNQIALTLDLLDIQVEYHSELISGHL